MGVGETEAKDVCLCLETEGCGHPEGATFRAGPQGAFIFHSPCLLTPTMGPQHLRAAQDPFHFSTFLREQVLVSPSHHKASWYYPPPSLQPPTFIECHVPSISGVTSVLSLTQGHCPPSRSPHPSRILGSRYRCPPYLWGQAGGRKDEGG